MIWQCRTVSLFMAADATSCLAGPGVHPERLVTKNPAVAVQNLQVDQSVGGHFDEKRTIRSQRNRPENPGMGSTMILPAVGRAVLLGLVAGDYGAAFDYANQFAAACHAINA